MAQGEHEVSDHPGDTVMRRLKPTLCLLALWVPLFAWGPVAVAAPDQFKLGSQVASPNALPAPAKARPAVAKGKAAVAAPAKAKPKGGKQAGKVAAKTKARKTADVIATGIAPAKIDLTLPKDMVSQLQPPGQEVAAKPKAAVEPADGKPLLPSLFTSKDAAEPFQLNGRLLSNEMDLQLRNESRREVDGAALDFKFKQ